MSDAARLRVVSYNIRSGRGNAAALAATVRAAAPDVLILQEAPRRFRWRQKCAALARAFGMVVAAGGMPALGNLILTDLRVKVVRTFCERFPLTPGRHLRGAAFAHCDLAGVPFVVAGSHLSLDPIERPRQAGLLANAITGVDAPAVLGVDVNDEPGSAAFDTLTAVLADPAHGAAADPAASAPTFPATAPRRRIDAMLVDRRLHVTSYRVLDSPAARQASDHLPVAVDLQLRS